MRTLLRQEALLLVAALVAALAFPLEHALVGHGRAVALAGAVVLIGAILLASLRVAHHAEELAEHVGEPYGTMILTLAAVSVEVVILAILMHHSGSPTLARDTIYSALMLDINALLGVSALLGGLRHGEQPYNVDSGNTYVVMILTAVGVSMVLPTFLPASQSRTYEIFTIVAMLLLYGLFLRLQVGRHSYFFSYSYAHHARTHRDGSATSSASADARTASSTAPQAGAATAALPGVPAALDDAAPAPHATGSVRLSIACLGVGIVLVALLSEVMSKLLDTGLEGVGMPAMFAPLLVATLSASPEILTALRAALANRMQPVVNIALGASLSTVILTVPIIEALALATGQRIDMALTPAQTAMVFLTLFAAMINIHDGETNAIEGMTHFVLFMAFLVVSILTGT